MQVQVVKPAVTASPILARQQTQVFVRKLWAYDWVEAPYLIPISAGYAAAPSIGSATFLYHYGTIKREDRTLFEQWAPDQLAGYWVKIVLHGENASETLWVGRLTDDMDDAIGSDADAAPAGDKTLVAYSLEHELDRIVIRRGQVWRAESSDSIQIGRVPTFNRAARRGWKTAGSSDLRGNRSSAEHPGLYFDTVPYFSDEGALWTHLDIARYLIDFHQPTDFALELGGLSASLGALVSVQDLDGETLHKALCRLIPASRGLGWTIRLQDDVAVVAVFSHYDRAVDLKTGTIGANTEQLALRFDDAIDLERAVTTRSRSRQYERVRARGARILSTGTFGVGGGAELDLGWAAADVTDYDAVAGSETEDKDRARRADKFRRVFQHFVVKSDWDGYCQGEGQGLAVPDANPRAGTIWLSTPGNLWIAEARFERYTALPLREIADDEAAPEPMPLLAIIQDADNAYWLAEQYRDVDAKCAGWHVRPLADRFGVELRGDLPHQLALNHWTGDTDLDPAVDYATLKITGSFFLDDRLELEAVLPGVADGEGRTLDIEVPDAQLWYVAPGTIVGVEDGALVKFDPAKYGGSYIVRDDSDELDAVARLALARYGAERARVSLAIRSLWSRLAVGQYITRADHGTAGNVVGTVVTKASWNFTDGTFHAETDYAEIDPRFAFDYGVTDPARLRRDQQRIATQAATLAAHTEQLDARTPPVPFESSSSPAGDRYFIPVTSGSESNPLRELFFNDEEGFFKIQAVKVSIHTNGGGEGGWNVYWGDAYQGGGVRINADGIPALHPNVPTQVGPVLPGMIAAPGYQTQAEAEGLSDGNAITVLLPAGQLYWYWNDNPTGDNRGYGAMYAFERVDS